MKEKLEELLKRKRKKEGKSLSSTSELALEVYPGEPLVNSRPKLRRLINNETPTIRMKDIDKLCEVLDCDYNTIFEMIKS